MAYVNRDVLSPGSPLAQMGEVSLFDGRWEEARSLLEEALTYLDDEDGIFLAIAKTDLADIALLQGEQDKARNWLVEAYKPASFHIRRWLVFLCTLAGYFVLSGKSKMDIYRAVQFYGAIEVLGMKSGIKFNSFYKSLNHERLQMARSKITEREWRKAYAEGRSWSREESLERADAELNT